MIPARTGYGLVTVKGVFGLVFSCIPETAPGPVFIARPNPPIHDADGNRIDVPQGTDNEGFATLLAWLYPIGSDERRYARISLPSGITRDVPPAWVHPAGNIAAIRLRRSHPWRRDGE